MYQHSTNFFISDPSVFTTNCSFSFPRLAAAQEAAAQHRAGRDWSSFSAMGGATQPGASVEKPPPGPSSLFVFSETNAIRRYTRFIIEWPYPLILIYFLFIFNLLILHNKSIGCPTRCAIF